MTEVIKVGLVGYGFASKTFHAPLLMADDGMSLQAVSSRDAAKVRADWPHVDVEASAAALFARDDLDLVVIPTPNDTHYDLARAALAAGKHVVIDKPFTVTLDEAESLVAQASRTGQLLSVFHNRRWDADFLTVQALLERGDLGRVVHVESHFDRYRPVVKSRWRESEVPGGGIWYDLGPHLIDQALVLFGRPEAILLDQACQRDGARVDDYFHAVLRYGQHRVILHAGSLMAAPAPRFALYGTQGSYIKHGLDPQEDMLKRGERLPTPEWGEDHRHGLHTVPDMHDDGAHPELREVPTKAGNYPAYYAGVREAIHGRGKNPVPAEDALSVMQVLEAGRRSAQSGRFEPLT
ncbi:putative dehydrogenase [Chromohalobacter marismortui]|uniref:Putative dehydrogenase n=1 Tax=Chromohalobacter marismortui TaxID=42055 RepID=A0A4R7NLE9_9GAMM|nr:MULTISPECIES: oxidoreductase [Chromohalobacter]MCI0510147.1 oxidoreductase [Chromohalobacter sp.]MCI0594858.1 oxidoreductase [Chromohalobacter sp.]TDU21563.1 putative dehydrogenase [Chromohalobacter marismortui]